MTSSRVVALRLFLKYLPENDTIDPAMLKAALAAADELVSINSGILRSGQMFQEAERRPFGQVVDAAVSFYPGKTRLMLDRDARQALVPASQLHLIVEELVRNAIKAEAPGRALVITVQARLRNRWLFRPRLLLDIIDNGTGMTRAVRKRALNPFFSTRAGNHLGLGLTGIADSLGSTNGKLRIRSIPDVGTVIKITYPL
ncbi:MAG: ATP-binding protein [Phyllobacterium sp.]